MLKMLNKRDQCDIKVIKQDFKNKNKTESLLEKESKDYSEGSENSSTHYKDNPTGGPNQVKNYRMEFGIGAIKPRNLTLPAVKQCINEIYESKLK